MSKNEQDLKEFADALEEHRAKGTEEQEMARKVQKSKRKATKGKARRESPYSSRVDRPLVEVRGRVADSHLSIAARRKAVSETPPSSPER